MKSKSTTNVKSNNQPKGPVFLSLNPEDREYGLNFGTITTDRIAEDGGLIIGTVERSHNIIDDNMAGFRIVEEDGNKRVERLEQAQVAEIVKLLKGSGQKLNMPVLESEINLIRIETGYQIELKDRSLVVDDVSKDSDDGR